MRELLYNKIRVTGCGSVWLERRLREAEVASSNLVTPIEKYRGYRYFFCYSSEESVIMSDEVG